MSIEFKTSITTADGTSYEAFALGCAQVALVSLPPNRAHPNIQILSHGNTILLNKDAITALRNAIDYALNQ